MQALELQKIRLASDAQPNDKTGTLYWITLGVTDLEGRIAREVAAFQHRYGTALDNARSQAAEDYRHLLAFENRMRTTGQRVDLMEVGPGELPLSFNDEIFAGHFIRLDCRACGRSSAPSETIVRAFADDDGMQAYGRLRCCPCGQPIAHQLQGYCRP